MPDRKRNLGLIIFAVLTVLPAVVLAQGSSLNTFSPYTFYGLGDMSSQGPAMVRAMGGAGVGFHSPYKVNSLNPASIGDIKRNTFIFNFELEGTNVYSKAGGKKTSFNTFNIRDISLKFSLHENMGISASISPYSNVGYHVDMWETDPYVLANVGSVRYMYQGEGGITEYKLGYGVRLFKKLYVGVEGIYYKGNINRFYDVIIRPVTSDKGYANTEGTFNEIYSHFTPNFGANYNIIYDPEKRRMLTFGATFKPKTNLKPTSRNLIITSGSFTEEVAFTSTRKDFYLPTSIGAGLFYETPNISLSMDYVFEHWKRLNPTDAANGIAFGNTNTIRAGVQYIPNPSDITRAYRRWSYRAGLKYSDYYMIVNGRKIRDYGITLGMGFPIKRSSTEINIGIELGKRGSTATGTYGTKQFNMVRENYFKVSIGFSLFGEDYWFVKYRYN